MFADRGGRRSPLFKPSDPRLGYTPIVGAPDLGLRYLKMGLLVLTPVHPRYQSASGSHEVAIVIISGKCSVRINGASHPDLGERSSMLSGMPTTVYVPRKTSWSIEVASDRMVAAVFGAEARRDTAPAIVRPRDLNLVTFGVGAWERQAAMVLVDNVDADRLLVGETYNTPGCWSSYPPHKHDRDSPSGEKWYEEIYHFAIEPPQGFGIQRIYSDPDDPLPVDQALVVENGDTVALVRGYHPVVAAGGYRLGYIWALAGEDRKFGSWSRDPRHEWVLSLEGKG